MVSKIIYKLVNESSRIDKVQIEFDIELRKAYEKDPNKYKGLEDWGCCFITHKDFGNERIQAFKTIKGAKQSFKRTHGHLFPGEKLIWKKEK